MACVHDVEQIAEFEDALTRLLKTAKDIFDAAYAALGILDSERTGLAHFIACGLDEHTRAAIGGLPRGRGVLGLLIEHPVPLRIDDVASDPRGYGFPDGHPAMHSFLGVPVLIDGEVWGNLYFAEKRHGAFDHADEHAAVTYAEHIAIVVKQARPHDRTRTQNPHKPTRRKASGRATSRSEIRRVLRSS